MYGGVGYTVTGERSKAFGRVKPPKGTWFDVDGVLQTSADALELWELHEAMPHVPLFSGGILDAWPNWAIDALRIQREEWSFVRAYVRQQEPKPKGVNRG